MKRLTYRAGSVDKTISLSGDDGLYAETVPNLRSGEWTYKQAGKFLPSRVRKSKTAQINVKAIKRQTLDSFLDLVDADVINNTPGTLTAVDDADVEWQAIVYIVKDSAQTVSEGVNECQLTVLVAEGVWRAKTEYQYVMDEIRGEGVDFPFDFPFDFSRSDISSFVKNDSYIDRSIDLVVYGPVSNPRITIADNTYAVDVNVSAGERLEVDSLRCFIQLVHTDGSRESVISKAHFSDGMNIFTSLPPHGGVVSWNNAFSFNVTVWQERGRAPWA